MTSLVEWLKRFFALYELGQNKDADEFVEWQLVDAVRVFVSQVLVVGFFDDATVVVDFAALP